MSGYSEEMNRTVRSLREHGFSQKATSEITGVSRASVQKKEPESVDGYDSELNKEWDDITDGIPDDVDPVEVVVDDFIPPEVLEEHRKNDDGPEDDPFKTRVDEEMEVTDDPENTTPGGFITDFFEELEAGVKTKFVKLQARRANRKKELPDEDKMLSDLEQMPSGVKGRTAQYVAEEYWEAAQQYLAESTATVFRGGPNGGSSTAGGQGNSVPVNGGQAQQGGWVQMPDGSQRYGRMEPQPDGSMRFVPMQPPAGAAPQPGMGGQQQGMSQREKELMREIRSLREEVKGDSSSGLKEQIEEMNEIQAAIQQLNGSGQDQANRALLQELRSLREDMTAGGGQAPSDPRQAVLQNVMQRDDVDVDTALDALDRVEGQTDPEIRKKEIDRELELKKMERKQERQSKIISSLEGVVETASQAFAAKLRESNDGNQRQQGQQQSQEPWEPPEEGQPTTDGGDGVTVESSGPNNPGVTDVDPMSETNWTCPECGEETPHPPGASGKECQHCGFSRIPCPDCNAPVSIPPADEANRGGCPDCGDHIPGAGDMEEVVCPTCGWDGPSEDALGDPVTCDSCDTEHRIGPAAQ